MFRRFGRNPSCRVLPAVLLAFSASLGQAQISQSQDRAQLLRNQPPALRDEGTGEESEGVAPASPNDADLGEQAILKRADQYLPWSVTFGAPVTYTSNVALVPNHEKSDTIFTPFFGVTYSPRITPTLYANFSIGQQMFYYDRFTALNFGSLDVRAGLSYIVPQWHNLVLRGDYYYNRLTTTDFDEFFSSHSVDLNAEIPFRIDRAQQISFGAETLLAFASDPSAPGRNEYSFFLAYTVELARHLTVNALFRVALRDYNDIDRFDVSPIFAVGATYHFTPWLAFNLNANFAWNDSNRDVFDYQVGNGGGSLSVTFKF